MYTLLLLTALAQPAPKASAPDSAEIQRLLRQLGHERFVRREAATAALVRIGVPALEALRKAAAGDADVEVRCRAEKISRSIQRRLDQTDIASVAPPRGAVILLDGKGLGGWIHRDGKRPPGWHLLKGGLIEPRGGDIMTRQTFAGPFRLHVEFRVPHLPNARGQARGNSGVYLQGRYEVQILDSHELPCDAGSCAAVYGLAAPRVNACKAPLVWQSFDIEFRPIVSMTCFAPICSITCFGPIWSMTCLIPTISISGRRSSSSSFPNARAICLASSTTRACNCASHAP